MAYLINFVFSERVHPKASSLKEVFGPIAIAIVPHISSAMGLAFGVCKWWQGNKALSPKVTSKILQSYPMT